MLMNDRGHFAAPVRSRGAQRPGLRERNKERKLERIVRAGRALFVQKGFEETTTRAIAAKAGVASGTFFLYFREKRDLLFHLFREDVSAVQEQAFASLPADAPLADRLAHVFGRFYAYYGRDPRLSRIFLKELLFLEGGERDDMLAFTTSAVARLAELVARARERKEVARWVDPMQVATHAFALYLFGLIGWLNGANTTPVLILAQLAAQLELIMLGISRRPRP
jgi:AcrR family transcriptional regulator